MITRIRPRPLLELARRDLPGPVDVVNLIHMRRFSSYRWYAVTVYPVMRLVGAGPLWMGKHDRTGAGEHQADKLLLVRYPSHRHFLAMTLNPYYLTINRLREAGVSRFEASFTRSSHEIDGLSRCRVLVGVHFRSPAGEDVLGRVADLMTPLAGELAYATKAISTLGFLDPPRPSDPNPLTLGELALFAPGDDAGPADADLADVAALLREFTDDVAVHVYRRESQREYRPSLGGAPGRVRAGATGAPARAGADTLEAADAAEAAAPSTAAVSA